MANSKPKYCADNLHGLPIEPQVNEGEMHMASILERKLDQLVSWLLEE
jgi:hypothetical protein